jgi:hypothetical protein
MATTIIFPVVYTSTIEPSFGRSLDMVPLVGCPIFDQPPWIGPSLGDGWNCNRCSSDGLFYNLWEENDIIPFQIVAGDPANVNPTMPTIGFFDSGSGAVAGTDYYVKIELLDSDCVTVIFDMADSFCSDYWVSFSGKVGPYQTFFVDTSLFPVNQNIWRLRMTTYLPSGAVASVTYTEIFKKVRCELNMLMQSSHAINDCLDHQYGVPTNFVGPSTPPAGSPTAFFMRWRFAGELIHTGFVNERETNDNDDVLSIKKRKTFDAIFRKMPPYAATILDTITSVSDVQIDADGNGFQTYQEATDVSKRIEGGTRMFKPRITVTQICEIDEFDCEQ